MSNDTICYPDGNFKRSSSDRMRMLESESINILKKLRSISNKNVIAFSGGKDSIVVADLCSSFGIKDSISESSFMFEKSKKEVLEIGNHFNLKMEIRDSLSWEWLSLNQKYCAPPMKIQKNLYAIRQQRTVKNYAEEKSYKAVVYGRRSQTNTVKSPIYLLKNGQIQCHPIRNWTTNDVWTYIFEKNLPFPSLYKHEIGIKEGFTAFLLPPEHFGGNVWESIHDYEPIALVKMASFHKPANDYLNKIKND